MGGINQNQYTILFLIKALNMGGQRCETGGFLKEHGGKRVCSADEEWMRWIRGM